MDGKASYQRCLSILAEVEDAETAFRDSLPHGLLRIDAHPLLTRTFLLPRRLEFLDRNPASTCKWAKVTGWSIWYGKV